MAGKRRRFKPYELFGRTVNLPEAVARVKGDAASVPDTCRYCKGDVKLVNNAEFYKGREYAWPLAYCCSSCGARVGCHPGTDIPLGSLADGPTMQARREAHDAFDRLWRGKTPGTVLRPTRLSPRPWGVASLILTGWMCKECKRVVSLCQSGALFV